MTTLKTKIKIGLLAVMLLLFTAFYPIFNNSIPLAYAANNDIKFDDTNVLDDLKSSTVNGKPFNLSDFPYSTDGTKIEPKILSFIEYCYSYKINMQSNYGLYVYFYNPQSLDLDTTNRGNKIQLAVSYGGVNGMPDDYEKFDLKFCSMSTDPNYYGLFYKYKVIDHKAEKTSQTIRERISEDLKNQQLSGITINDCVRRYNVSGVELVERGKPNANDYWVAQTLKFTGFAKGYGANPEMASTLDCTAKALKTAELKVKHTNYRTDSSTVGKDHRNELNTVYFAVDNTLVEEFGRLQKIKAEWWEYKTTPIVVTEDKPMYDTLQNYIGKTLQGGYDSSLPYKLGYNRNHISTTPTLIIDYGWSYNVELYSSGNTFITSQDVCNSLFYSFYSEGESIKDYVLPAEKVSDYIYKYDKSFIKGTLPIKDNSISADLFLNNVDSGRTRGYNCKDIDASDEYNLFSYTDANKGFWDKVGDYGFWDTLFGKTPTDGNIVGLKPIYDIKATDLNGTDKEISNNLLIQERDADDLKSYYESETKKTSEFPKGKTVYLFRYAVTDYFSGILYGENANVKPVVMQDKSYIAQESVFLDFDILQLTFNKDGVYTIIPVVSNPIDIINGIDPPIEFEGNGCQNTKLILMIALIVLLLIICAPILPHIINFFVWLILGIFNILLFPFRAISKTIKKNKK